MGIPKYRLVSIERESISDVGQVEATLNGAIQIPHAIPVTTQTAKEISSVFSAVLVSFVSPIDWPYAIPTTGPISGDTNIDAMMVADESAANPNAAMIEDIPNRQL
mmetsp:Transcript_26160/g.62152  ORF Transcript_26160/g.62152 Transcript_26160/m.62152 type:complete len:106 (+) Transcript_26160:622-939(+)